MINETNVAFENVQTSNRTAEDLARLHGFESLVAFTENLPENAKVADIGSGDSTLGREVAAMRPDVQWTNIDYSYFQSMPEIATNDGPNNLIYIAGDATKLGEILEPGSQDVILSYFMLSHLSLRSDETVDRIAREMFMAAKPDGLLSIGPDMSQMRQIPVGNWPPAFQVKKDGQVDINSFAGKVVRDTKARGLTRLSLLASSEVIAPFFGTSRYLKRDDKNTALVYDPKNGEYVSPFSSRGLNIAKELVQAGSHHIAEQHKDKLSTARSAAIAAGAVARHIATKRKTRF